MEFTCRCTEQQIVRLGCSVARLTSSWRIALLACSRMHICSLGWSSCTCTTKFWETGRTLPFSSSPWSFLFSSENVSKERSSYVLPLASVLLDEHQHNAATHFNVRNLILFPSNYLSLLAQSQLRSCIHPSTLSINSNATWTSPARHSPPCFFLLWHLFCTFKLLLLLVPGRVQGENDITVVCNMQDAMNSTFWRKGRKGREGRGVEMNAFRIETGRWEEKGEQREDRPPLPQHTHRFMAYKVWGWYVVLRWRLKLFSLCILRFLPAFLQSYILASTCLSIVCTVWRAPWCVPVLFLNDLQDSSGWRHEKCISPNWKPDLSRSECNGAANMLWRQSHWCKFGLLQFLLDQWWRGLNRISSNEADRIREALHQYLNFLPALRSSHSIWRAWEHYMS